MSTELADRVMHARRESLCPVCWQPIRVGQLIARAGTWQHIRHLVKRHPGVCQLRAVRIGATVALVDGDGARVADLDPAEACHLARQLDDAARSP